MKHLMIKVVDAFEGLDIACSIRVADYNGKPSEFIVYRSDDDEMMVFITWDYPNCLIEVPDLVLSEEKAYGLREELINA